MTTADTLPIVTVRNLEVRAGSKPILRMPGWQVDQKAHTLVLGPSGSGKTTLFHALAGLVPIAEGEVRVDGIEPNSLSAAALDRWRGRALGLIFQRYHLVGALSLIDNLLLAPYFAGLPRDRTRAEKLLDRLGLGDRLKSRPGQLSQGEMQRVAIARALMNEPRLILADEPTASLDDDRAQLVASLLREEAERVGAALIVATHDVRLKGGFEQTLELEQPA